jgi:hypothetical protein
MDHLSSCYFCGAALDEPLGAYSLTPADGGRPVTLCASCRHKLDTLLEANDREPTVPADESEQTDDSSAKSESAMPDESDQPGTDTDSATADGAEPATSKLDESADSELGHDPDETGLDTDDTEDEVVSPEESTDTDVNAEPTIASGSVAATGPEPVTTDPSELPDDEDVHVVPGLAAEADESDDESTLSEQMEPTVPDEFGESGDEAETAASSEDDGATTDSLESLGGDTDDALDSLTADADDESTDTEDESIDETDDILGDTGGVDTTPIDPEEAEDPLETGPSGEDSGLQANEDSSDEATAEGVDPSILQADEIATGKADIEAVLGEDTDVPVDTESTEFEDESEPDDAALDEAGVEDETQQDPIGLDSEDESVTEDEPFDIEPDDEPDDAPEPDEGGFTFDNGPDTDDEDLQSEMEPDIPEEFSSTAEEIAGATTNETDPEELPDEEVAFEGDDETVEEPASTADDEAVEEMSTDRDEQPNPSPEEIAFGDSESDESQSESNSVEGNERQPESESESGANSESVDAEDRRSISALEYNKVMRLLQNREFPIDRMELLAVAASTYDLSQAECEAVLDIAVERGLLAEDGNQLVKPD